MEPVAVQIEGKPLSEIGLDGLMIRYADGTEEPLTGLAIISGQTVSEAIEEALPKGACLFVPTTTYVRETKPMAKSAAEILSREQLAQLRDAGFAVIHREPTDAMAKAFYAGQWPEAVSFKEGFHRMVGASIREQNED